MAVEGIGNLVQNLADHLFQQGQATPAVTQVVGAHNVGTVAPAEDTFTPSTQSGSAAAVAQAAGIFQLNPGTPTTSTAGVLSAQAPSNAAPSASPAATRAGNPSALQSATGAAEGPGANSGQAAPDPAATADLQLEIQRLNAALPALGLTNSQIQQIDRIASLIGDFNPAAYANLVTQFESQSQNVAQQAAPVSPLSAASGSGPAPGSSTNSSDNGFQVQEILTPAANSQGNAQPSSSNASLGSSASPAVFNAPGLQSQQIDFAPANATGQDGQTQPPQQASGPGT